MNQALPCDAGRRPTRRALAVAGLFILLLIPGPVLADAALVTAVPGDGDALTTLPAEAVLTFDEALDNRSSFAILDSSGASVASGALDPADPTVIRGALPALAAGIYEVQWVAGSADSHLVRGTYQFTVAEPTPPPPTPTPAPTDEPSAEPTPTAAPSPTPAPSPSPSSDGGNGAGATEAIIPIVVMVLLVGAGLVFFLRRRGPA